MASSALMKWRSFRESNLIFIKFYLETSDLELWGLEIMHLKVHNSVWQGCFFFHYYLPTLMTDWAQIFKGYFAYYSMEE